MLITYDRNLTIHGVFEQQAATHPDSIALVLPRKGKSDLTLTYAELDRRANHLAAQLIGRGVKPGTFVTTFMDRSLESIVAFLGILKAGAAYVPLDPEYPRDRLIFMLSDTNSGIVLAHSHLIERLPEGARANVMLLDAGFASDAGPSPTLPRQEVTGSDLAYVIYTSGSTGRPKGVCVPHRGVVRLVIDNTFTPMNASTVFLQLAPVSFDAATLEIWAPLLHGGKCVLYPGAGVPDFDYLGEVIRSTGVTSMWLTSSLFNLVIDRAPQTLRSVKEVLAGGEALSVVHIKRALEVLPNTQLVNGYGPTESTTFTCCYRIPRRLDPQLTSIPIGTPIAHTYIRILDDTANKNEVPKGEIGDLYIGGDGLATGYLNRPELTADRFVEIRGERLYYSGDRARIMDDGNVEFLGRLDDQVKIAGHRIELGEIETALNDLPEVTQACVLAREDTPGDKKLVAYVVGKHLTAGKLRLALEAKLPVYMVPGAFVFLDALPLSPMGKVDRKALPKPGNRRPDLETAYVAPKQPLEKLLASLWTDLLELDSVGINDRFFELGGTSLQAVKFVARLSAELGQSIPIVSFFEAPTIQAIANVLVQDFPEAVAQKFGGATRDVPGGPASIRPSRIPPAPRLPSDAPLSDAIAIIGLAGRFAGSPNADAFWENLKNGREATRPVTAEDLERQGLDPALLANPDFVPLGFPLDEVELFDGAFFGMTPREVELMDPQQRIFLETAYAALENAGYDASRYAGRIGVFGGIGRNPYLYDHIARQPEYADRLIEHHLQIGNERDFPATHVAYKLDLRGPAVNVQTACSTSGVALHFACQSLRTGDSDMCLVGGAKILVPIHGGHMFVDGGALAPDGHVRAFDANAGGMVRGNGCGMVVLKRLSDALRDGDNIRAIVKSTSVNNDGGQKIGFTAPSVQGQAECIARALDLAGLTADDISYVETHGTGTILGDPMEVAGLTRAFRKTSSNRGYCGIGSVKTNIGHLDAGALAAGLIKTVLALENQLIPPSLNFERPNPRIDFDSSPFFVVNKPMPWPKNESKPRRAGISAFGLGGTNAHIIVEEAPTLPPTGEGRSHELLLLSAKTDTALAKMRADLASWLEKNPNVPLADVGYTLAVGRRRHAHRATFIAESVGEAIAKLRSDNPTVFDARAAGPTAQDATSVAFMFPGGGAQYVRMAQNLRSEASFAQALHRCAEIAKPILGVDLRDLIYPVSGANGANGTNGAHKETPASKPLERPFHALPALFAVEYSVACLLRSWGVEPSAMIGHSMGEYTAACLAGVMSLTDALGVVACRGRLFEKLPRGSMLGLPLSADEAKPFMTPDLSFAAINRKNQCVASGPVESIEALFQALERADIEATRIHIDVAAHSGLVEPILAEFEAFLRKLEFSAPRIPFVSNVTGTWITDAEAQDPVYWVRHLRQTVRFADGIDTLLSEPGRALVEVGPGRTLTSLTKGHPHIDKDLLLSTLPHPNDATDDVAFLERAIGRLWLAGINMDHSARYLGFKRRRVPIPSYPFERVRHWIERPRNAAAASALAAPPAAVPISDGMEPSVQVVQEPHPHIQTLAVVEPPPPTPRTIPPQQFEVVPPPSPIVEPAMPELDRKTRIIHELQKILQELSGLDASRIDPAQTFLELGFDSLFLTQANGAFRKRFGVKTTVRQLLEKAPGVGALAELLDSQLAPDAFPPEAPAAPVQSPAPSPLPAGEMPMAAPEAPQPAAPAAAAAAAAPAPAPQAQAAIIPQPPPQPMAAIAAPPAGATTIERVINQQLAIMQEQLVALRGGVVAQVPVAITQPQPAQQAAPAVVAAAKPAPQQPAAAAPKPAPVLAPPPPAPTPVAAKPAAPTSSRWNPDGSKPPTNTPVQEKKVNKESPWQPVDKNQVAGELTAEQQNHIDALIRKVCERAPTSKAMTQEHRAHFADPRTVQGFRLQWKDMVFPLVAQKSLGSKIWDVDGNEYIDLVNGYGVTFLGHNPPFIRDAVNAQLDRGVEIGPQNYMAGKLARLVCDLTGMDRAAFCNTGSEAVLAAIRLARTVTGKDGIATFAGHYHGIFDEVLVKGVTFGGKRKTVPIAPGIPQRHVENTLVLKYGDMESLEEIRKNADELALVMVEPIRSRNPDNQPVEFVRALRKLTEECGIALLFDEMVTGFRAHPGGMQALWGIRADLATYGKVVGGGYPIGVVTGKSKYMDALDGGMWKYGDSSVPEADMTWFAGTFVRHPLAMAASYATLSYLKEKGPALQEELNRKTTAFAAEMNAYFDEVKAPLWMEHFSSFVVLKFTSFQDYSQLLFYHLHNRGIFTYEGRPAFFTTAHTDEDFAKVAKAMKESIEALQRVGLFPGTPIEREPRKVPMSEGQQEIWLATRFGRDASCAFNLASTLHLRGDLKMDALKKAVTMLSKRHEALRCVPNADGQTQRVMPPADVPLPIHDLTALTADRDQKLEQLRQMEVTTEFDLDNGPLFRAKVIKLAEEEHLLILTAHHLIADGWSCGVMCREVGKLYASIVDGKPHGLTPALPYSEWIKERSSDAVSEERKQCEDYWVSQYAGSPVPVLDLPTDRPRPPVKTFAADRLSLKLDENFAAGLRKMAGQQGATLFSGLLSTFHVLLARLSGQTDICVGFSLAGQSDVEGRELVGHCVQFLPLRLQLDRAGSFGTHVKHVRGKVFDAFENKSFSFGTLLKRLNVPRDPSRVPLMSVAFNLDPSSLGIEFHDLKCTAGSIPRRYENFDIFFNVVELSAAQGGGLDVQCTFNLDLFDRETMRRRLDQYKVLLESAMADATRPVQDMPILPAAEREKILVQFNQTEMLTVADHRIHEIISEQAIQFPDSIAVVSGNSRMTYRELDTKSNQLAHYLQSRGAVAGKRVGVCMPRVPELVVALLGVLKAGGAYVPIDPTLPIPRINYMLRDAQIDVVLTHSSVAAVVPVDRHTIRLDEWPAEIAERPVTEVDTTAFGESVAYVMYTSGSTGEPKGVMVPHRALEHYLAWATKRYRMREQGSGSPVHSSIGFDLTVTSLFGPLLCGKQVWLVEASDDVEALGRALENPGGFSAVKITPAHLSIVSEQLPSSALAKTAGTYVVGGEQLLASHVAAFRSHAPNVKIVNEYGPTEATVGCCIHEVTADSPKNGAIPIGRPSPGTRLYILDDRLAPVPIGVAGELYIGGPQVALGYLNRLQLTAARFVEDPFARGVGGRMYKTGDLARYLPSGEIEYIGRTDHQVKIRGYRIELGEIEKTIEADQSVERAVVIARGANAQSRTLAAFVIPRSSENPMGEEAPTQPSIRPGAINTRLSTPPTASQVDQKEAWRKKWDALYEAGAQALQTNGNGANGGELDDLVLLRELSDKTHYEAEVKEGLDATYARLSKIDLGRAWAIGCGTGAELLRIAPQCKTIYGTDYAEGGIREIERLLKTPKYADLKNVTVAVRDGDDFAGVKEGSFDTVIINSVCQYFPDGAYFRRVLEGSMRAIGAKGVIFIGDVQSNRLLEAHHAYDQLDRSPPNLSSAELQGLVQRRMQTEDELVVDPAFFFELWRENPSRIGWIDIQHRRGHHQNETTRFHYDVWIHIGPPPPSVAGVWRDWEREGFKSADDVKKILSSHLGTPAGFPNPPAAGVKTLAINNIPNWRNSLHLKAAELLHDAVRLELSDVAAIKQRLGTEPPGIDPETLWKVGEDLGYDVEIRWTDVDGAGRYEAVFTKPGETTKIEYRKPDPIPAEKGPWWTITANEPAKKFATRKLTQRLREMLAEKLPAYMIPASFTVLEAFPLTHNGKVDVAALAAMDASETREAKDTFTPPRTEVEKQVAAVWCEVLSLGRVSMTDDFFEIGGHSLLGVQIIVRLRELMGLPELSLSSLFSTPTVATLSQKIESMQYQQQQAAAAPAGGADGGGEREEMAF